MFSALSRVRFNTSFGSYLILFCVLQLIFLLCISSVTFTVRHYLMAYCQQDISQLLERYLGHRATGVIVSKQQPQGLMGLTFVRLISESEQSFYSDQPNSRVDFKGLINLDPQHSAVWISLEEPQHRGSWVVVAKELENGNVIQAGAEYRYALELYNNIKTSMSILAGMSIFVALGVTLFCRNRSLALIHTAERSLARIVSHNKEHLLEDSGKSELANLYQTINQLVIQNRQLVKEMQESLDNVAHDLRTPITRLRSVAEYGLQQESPEKLVEALSDCLEESERVSSMLGIMMSVVEAEAGTMQLSREKISLQGTIADVLGLYEYVADENNIDLQMNIDPDVMIDADKTRITQVWANLVDNAVKYGNPGGHVTVSAKQEGRNIAILFEDDGMGISSSEIARIWERLFRGDRSRTQQGLGLGLNYVKAVIEAHDGTVQVRSTLGKGSCFEVRLPVIQGAFKQDYVGAKSQIRGA